MFKHIERLCLGLGPGRIEMPFRLPAGSVNIDKKPTYINVRTMMAMTMRKHCVYSFAIGILHE